MPTDANFLQMRSQTSRKHRRCYSAYSGAGVRSGFFSRSLVSVAPVNRSMLARWSPRAAFPASFEQDGQLSKRLDPVKKYRLSSGTAGDRGSES